MKPLLTPQETAEILGVSEHTLSVWRCRGRYDLQYVKVGHRVMYAPSEVQRFVDSRTYAHPQLKAKPKLYGGDLDVLALKDIIEEQSEKLKFYEAAHEDFLAAGRVVEALEKKLRGMIEKAEKN